jgi:hypothetical protein
MQFQVPQFIEVEDRIFGPLTFKQFVYLAGGLGAGYLLYRVLPFIVAAPLIMAIVGFAAALAFIKFNGRPFISSARRRNSCRLPKCATASSSLKDGSLRAVLLASSINFALKSKMNRPHSSCSSKIFSIRSIFRANLRAVAHARHSPIHCDARSAVQRAARRFDARIQIREYIEFVKSFTEAANIMTKNFFVVVPYSARSLGTIGAAALLPFGKKTASAADQEPTKL